MGELVRVRREGDVAVVTLHRPEKLNALSTALEEELGACLDDDPVASARALVLEGAGRAFSAGADVNEMTGQTPADILRYYPTTAAIHGYCLGGGFELSLAADLRIADETAAFGLPEVAIGIVPSSGGFHRLVRAVGPARAKELILLRERIDAERALALGVV